MRAWSPPPAVLAGGQSDTGQSASCLPATRLVGTHTCQTKCQFSRAREPQRTVQLLPVICRCSQLYAYLRPVASGQCGDHDALATAINPGVVFSFAMGQFLLSVIPVVNVCVWCSVFPVRRRDRLNWRSPHPIVLAAMGKSGAAARKRNASVFIDSESEEVLPVLSTVPGQSAKGQKRKRCLA